MYTHRYTDKDRETHSVYVLSDVLEGRAGLEGGKEATLVQVLVNTDRYTDRYRHTGADRQVHTGTHTKTDRETHTIFCTMSWKVRWVLNGTKSPCQHRCG